MGKPCLSLPPVMRKTYNNKNNQFNKALTLILSNDKVRVTYVTGELVTEIVTDNLLGDSLVIQRATTLQIT